MDEAQKAEKSKIWDIVLLKDNGAWEGFRAPERALQKTVNYFVVLFLIAAFGSVGWFWSRWELGRAESELALTRLQVRSLKAQVSSLKTGFIKPDSEVNADQITILPGLSDKPVASQDLDLTSIKLSFDGRSGQVSLDFEAVKTARSALGSEKLYWILLLHGARGVQAFPAALTSRTGQALMPLKGQLLENLARNRKVHANFKAQGFFEDVGTDPVYGTLLIYDQKGSLLIKRRASVSATASPSGPKAAPSGGGDGE